ncbi:ABC transporter ATP-binding protein [Aeromicrobium duanguangcaii]|uniref:ATP-binding cassette domain-containing protein n=1 Tax=Aeromicrobium duanguangcaii TaxID=2968086 RepID=A0ABY5KFI9_9ACTN|nr:ABC transporter ATP-binding protein [Aeromicrobium duanguangcaii]MCD9155130.1 ATP-binding cassette domain-containing protein [Aeromicrobium duanguangcaii]MCL3838476.1 ATP-binding cassette domain-containing protein [Aeromicrobium duanguangcaii]UUI68216.1 ATP-binding cassette domain-containing protein [Aeromicrobium duanguangcaii]
MISFDDVTFWYDGADVPTLAGVDLEIDEGELVLVSGRTGSGKSTLLAMVNGLVPHFTGGTLAGDIRIDGASIVGRPPRELAHLVGYVAQDPLSGFVADVVEDELAYGMEHLGLDPQTMRRRVEETLDLLGIADLRRRSVRSLSGGQQQRVAIGSVLTMHPRVLVLDEPTSALDPTAAEDVLATIARLVDDLALTVIVAEHRMERVVPFADRLVLVEDGRVRIGDPAELLVDAPVAPPLVQLGRLADWRPLPLSVREARRRVKPLAARLGPPPVPPTPERRPALQARGITVRYGHFTAVDGVDLRVGHGEVVALMGRNGSGKSSLLWAVQGTGDRTTGVVDVDGVDPGDVRPAEARMLVGLVPQTAADLLYLETVDRECAAADDQAGVAPGTCRALLERLAPGIVGRRHPRDLSEGQKLALVLAVVLTAQPAVVALDEPTRGLDYPGKAELARILHDLAADGHGIVVSSHDVEFVAAVADTVVVLADGEVVSSGPVREVLAESPAFAPQVSKVLGPDWLTVDEVAAALPSEVVR